MTWFPTVQSQIKSKQNIDYWLPLLTKYNFDELAIEKFQIGLVWR